MACNQLKTMNETYYTLIFIKDSSKILLGFKKRGLGKNTWNGYGGKLQENEDIFDCAIRELKEESNLNIKKDKLNYLGVVIYDDNRNMINHRRIVYIFNASSIDDEPVETEEMRPQWFNFQNIPYDNMWPDSKFWLPLVLKDGWLIARFTYKGDYEIVDYVVKELHEAPSLTNGIQDYMSIKSSQEDYEYKDCAIYVENV
ncbi:hypothetical protein ILUMI_10511 [Ignelater luminosus]|uniref:Oxidized purine nucleoside triphosphate hydrolase n=1 Tax=Ignelater luminosus TaxID=2038154 RepID=A0A8K0D292_IGNLU|nr:hypothetical protein ILUMI_10511 [Ignelater luminosus]